MSSQIKYTLEIDDDGFVKVVKQATEGVEGLDKAVEKTSKNSSTNLTSMTTKMADLTLAINGTIQIAKGLVNTFSDMANVAKRVKDSQTGLTEQQRDYSVEMEKTTGLHKTEVNILQQKANAYGIQKDKQKEMIKDAIILGKETGNYADILKKMAESASNGDYSPLKEILPTIQGGKDNAITDAIKWTEYLNQKKIELDASMSNNSGAEAFNNAMITLKEAMSSSIVQGVTPLLKAVTPLVELLGSYSDIIVKGTASVIGMYTVMKSWTVLMSAKSLIMDKIALQQQVNIARQEMENAMTARSLLSMKTYNIMIAERFSLGQKFITYKEYENKLTKEATDSIAKYNKAVNASGEAMKALGKATIFMAVFATIYKAIDLYVESEKKALEITQRRTAQNKEYTDSINEQRQAIVSLGEEELLSLKTRLTAQLVSHKQMIALYDERIAKEKEQQQKEADAGVMRDAKSAERLKIYQERRQGSLKRMSDDTITFQMLEDKISGVSLKNKADVQLEYEKLKREGLHRISQLNKEAMDKELDEANFKHSEAIALITKEFNDRVVVAKKGETLLKEQIDANAEYVKNGNSLIALEVEANAKIINDIKVKYHDIDKANQEKANKELADANSKKNADLIKAEEDAVNAMIEAREKLNAERISNDITTHEQVMSMAKEVTDATRTETERRLNDLNIAHANEVTAKKALYDELKLSQVEYESWLLASEEKLARDRQAIYAEYSKDIADILGKSFKDLFEFPDNSEALAQLAEEQDELEETHTARLEAIDKEMKLTETSNDRKKELMKEKMKLEKDYAKQKASLAKKEAELDKDLSDKFIDNTKTAIKAAIDMLAARGAAAAFASALESVPFPFNLVAAPIAYTGAYVAISAAKNLFRKGGYTGDGNPDEEAGVVHKKEFVLTDTTTERVGIPALQSLQDGRATIVPITQVSRPDAYTGSVNTVINNRNTSTAVNPDGTYIDTNRDVVVINNSDFVSVSRTIENKRNSNRSVLSNRRINEI